MRACVIALCVVAGSASAQQATPDDIDCSNAINQYEMNHCALRAYIAADEDLNDTYGWAMDVAKGWSGEAANALRAAQRAWIPYRDAACIAEGSAYEGGSIQPLIIHGCKEHLTRQRTEEMRAVYEMN
ncbi:lysozyme inhibitor LprI family protein [Celeribacter marinus]|uniref:Putative periplasmic protein n=1 Tax=Celeribacter marinus TaxID=1397108 RepID=A0A0N9ZI47_9RHOB|nr:lysozyme inhibitor LprI family protein [Celeribacter marinus]ALI56326.1 putative periplasmic protein [Celeribacter marinus]SFK46024.1 Uncharacterized conserved protein YecT, DUF1311 family [Celeribacter marinus]